MNRRCHAHLSLVGFLAAGSLAPWAGAQLIGPIPPRAPAAFPNTEAGGGPVPEVRPPEGEPLAPSIIERDSAGRLKPLDTSPEEAVVAKYPFDEAHRAKIAASKEARRVDVDRFVVANLDKVLEAQRLGPQVHAASDFSTLFKARDAAGALRMERPLDRLLRDGAISLEHKTRLEEALREFDTARKKQIDKDSADDPSREAVLNLRQTFDDVTREPLGSLDRQLDEFAAHAESVLDGLTIRDNQRKAAEAFRNALRAPDNAPGTNFRRELVHGFWLDILDTEQKREALIAARRAASPKQP